jgi:hypothetical protein
MTNQIVIPFVMGSFDKYFTRTFYDGQGMCGDLGFPVETITEML